MLPLYKFAKFVFRYLIPPKARYPVVRVIAWWVCLLNAPRRNVIIGNLTPLVGEPKARAMAPQVLGSFLETAVDFFCSPRTLNNGLEFENWSILPRAYEATRRVIMVTAHIGHWEIGMGALVERGYAMSGVYAPYTNDAIVQWILSHRNPKVEWIAALPGAADLCVSALERGRVLGMVADIPFSEIGRKVAIHGHTARLPIGPWLIAARAQATVIPAFIVRVGDGKYRGTFLPGIKPGTGTARHQIAEMQEAYRKHLETYLGKYPQQWGVLQPFWVR